MTKKTRQLIRLNISSGINPMEIMQPLSFKGAIKITSEFITPKQILDAWSKNKTVICFGTISDSFKGMCLEIPVTSNEANPNNVICVNCSNVSIVEQFTNITEKNNIDVGDHKSNSSGIAGAPSIENCSYCNYIKNHFYDSKINALRIIYKSKHFYVMPTLGEFINGYLLIIPLKHIMSSACLNSPYLFDELYQVIEDVKYILQLTYKKESFLIWENGTGHGGYGKAKDSVVHAHVHIAPSNLTPQAIKDISGFSFKEISFREISNYEDSSYLLLKGNESSWFINSDSELYIPRQYIRQLIADEYNLGDVWNWRQYYFADKILETIDQIKFALKANWSQLPCHIKDRVIDYVEL